MRAAPLALIVAAACGSAPHRFLGAPTPPSCAADLARCRGDLDWRLLRETRSVGDPALLAYVSGIEARVAAASTLGYRPEIALDESTTAVAVDGGRIAVGRALIVVLGTEAELAAILAHETVHLEAAHEHSVGYVGEPIDEESVADERAATLLVRAGYPPHALPRALTRLGASFNFYDAAHGPVERRIWRTQLLADQLEPAAAGARAGDADPREGRERFLAAIDRRAIAEPRGRGVVLDEVWIAADLDLALPLPAGSDHEDGAAEVVEGHDGRLVGVGAYIGSAPLAAAVRATLTATREVATPVGRAIAGLVAHAVPADAIERTTTDLVDVTTDGSRCAVIAAGRGGALVCVAGSGTDDARADSVLMTWLHRLRRPTAAELRFAQPMRVVLARADHTATVRELVQTCGAPATVALALVLDDPDRVVRAGDRFKCADQVAGP